MGVWRGRERVPSAGAGRAARSPSLPFLASRLAPDRSRAFAPVPLVAPRAREPPPSAAPDGDHRARRRAAARPAQGRVHRGRGRVSGGCVRWREGPRGADGGVRPSTSPPPRPRPPCAGRTADDAIRALNAAHAAYRRVEASLTAARARLLAKAPDIDKALAAVRLLQERRDAGDEVGWGGRGGVGLEPFPWTARADAHLFGPPRPPPPQSIDVDFGLADQVFTAATIPTKDPSVCLWLGAGVSVEYPLDEAATLLSANAANAAANLEANARDLAFVKDCVTTTQVGGEGEEGGRGRARRRRPRPASDPAPTSPPPIGRSASRASTTSTSPRAKRVAREGR